MLARYCAGPITEGNPYSYEFVLVEDNPCWKEQYTASSESPLSHSLDVQPKNVQQLADQMGHESPHIHICARRVWHAHLRGCRLAGHWGRGSLHVRSPVRAVRVPVGNQHQGRYFDGRKSVAERLQAGGDQVVDVTVDKHRDALRKPRGVA